MKKLRIGMVGAGNIANVHLNAYQTLDNVEIAAICDINAERLNETADLFNIEKSHIYYFTQKNIVYISNL